MFKFFVVAARLFLVFCVCLNFDDLGKQWRKMFRRVSEVEKTDFSVCFCRLCVFFLVFFSLLRSRATYITKTCAYLIHTHVVLLSLCPDAPLSSYHRSEKKVLARVHVAVALGKGCLKRLCLFCAVQCAIFSPVSARNKIRRACMTYNALIA